MPSLPGAGGHSVSFPGSGYEPSKTDLSEVEWINHSEGMLTPTVPCRMSENQREETVVSYKWQREMSKDTKRREGKKKEKKNEACKLYMLEFSLNQKVLQKNILPLLS